MASWNATTAPELLLVGSPPVLTLVSLYGVVLVVGVVGNAIVAVLIFTQQSQRMRNHLLLNLCVADLLVCALSGSLTAATSTRTAWALGEVLCKITVFFQTVPVGGSTLSLMMLSVDRYASVKHPRLLTQLRHQRHLVAVMVTSSWAGALLTAAPAVYAATVVPEDKCEELWESEAALVAFTTFRLVLVWVVPCCVVAACHLAVGQKLCEVSLTAAAARGELPLPMPVLRRRKHVIIVASVPQDGPSKMIPYHCGDLDDDDDSSENEGLALQICADLNDFRQRPKYHQHNVRKIPAPSGRNAKRLSRGQKASRSERSIVRANRRLRRPPPPLAKPPLVKTGSGQSLKSRRHLANLLYLQVAVFAVCWLPHVACVLCVHLASADDAKVARDLLPFSLLLGHAHSALHPVLYWLLNRQSLQIQGCAPWWPWNRGEDGDTHFPKHGLFRLTVPHRKAAMAAPSSTNEAALGVFHPRYNVPRPEQRQRFPTSHFLQ